MDGREQNRAGQELEGVWQQRAQDAWSLATGWRRGIQLCLESVVFKRSTMMCYFPRVRIARSHIEEDLTIVVRTAAGEIANRRYTRSRTEDIQERSKSILLT